MGEERFADGGEREMRAGSEGGGRSMIGAVFGWGVIRAEPV